MDITLTCQQDTIFVPWEMVKVVLYVIMKETYGNMNKLGEEDKISISRYVRLASSRGGSFGRALQPVRIWDGGM